MLYVKGNSGKKNRESGFRCIACKCGTSRYDVIFEASLNKIMKNKRKGDGNQKNGKSNVQSHA